MNTLVGETGNAGAVVFGGPQAAPAQFQVGAVGFGPAWSDALHDEMDDAGICTICGHRMTPVRAGKAQCDFCEATESMARSIVRLECENDELRAEVALLQEQARIMRRDLDGYRDAACRDKCRDKAAADGGWANI